MILIESIILGCFSLHPINGDETQTRSGAHGVRSISLHAPVETHSLSTFNAYLNEESGGVCGWMAKHIEQHF